jgi:hypothetical protein
MTQAFRFVSITFLVGRSYLRISDSSSSLRSLLVREEVVHLEGTMIFRFYFGAASLKDDHKFQVPGEIW